MKTNTDVQTALVGNQTELAKAIRMALRAGSAAALLCIGVPSAVSAQSEFEESVKLDELDGTDGFAFSTISAYNSSFGVQI